jgi:hypothetical protein
MYRRRRFDGEIIDKVKQLFEKKERTRNGRSV